MKFSVLITIISFFLIQLAEASELDCVGMDHPAHQNEYHSCLRAQSAIAAKAAGVDCYDCMVEQETPENSGVLEVLSAAIQPAAYIMAEYTKANFQHKSQKAWADTFASSSTQCTARYNTFMNYNTAVGANPVSSTDAAAFSNSCNGFGYGAYAGFGGYMGNSLGGFNNPYQALGYSSNYLSLYGGPYANMNGGGSLYNNGMLSGSIGVSGTLSGGSTLTSSTSGVTAAFGF